MPRDFPQVIATGYELERSISSLPDNLEQSDNSETKWTERVLLLHSTAYEQQQRRGLEQRLQRATEKLMTLTPPVGLRKRQIREESLLHQKAQSILKQHRLEGLLSYSYQYYPPSQKRQKGRYQITDVERNSSEIESASQRFGWRVYVTNAPTSGLSFEDAVLTYRDEWIAERGFHRFKGKPLSITPFVAPAGRSSQGVSSPVESRAAASHSD